MYNVNKNNTELNTQATSKYYGQWETDKIIESYFKNKSDGICIEVGAANGYKGSNTKYFEDIGWDALCIEPNIEHKESLTAHRKFVRYYACGKENKELPLHIFRVGKDDITSSLTSLSPDERLVEDHKEIINDSYKVDVKVRTLNWILENETSDTPFENVVDIDFISIDTEGTELDVIKGLDFDKYSVKLLIIENNYNDDNIEEYMNLMGYKKDKRYKINDFYIKHDENKI